MSYLTNASSAARGRVIGVPPRAAESRAVPYLGAGLPQSTRQTRRTTSTYFPGHGGEPGALTTDGVLIFSSATVQITVLPGRFFHRK
ncbi:MAG: hypothetical protein IT581_04755 [Verrucomicrobiales bacterium]|nr:hypothetical protein [Verrucomicrobiales bacterium]